MITKISGYFLYIFSVLVYRTCRLTITGFDQVEKALKTDKPLIITSWHGMTMMIIAFIKTKFDIKSYAGIIPDDYRGDVLEVFAKYLGVDAIPLNLHGDTTLGTGRKLVGMMKRISSGKNFVIHPDGPAGPAYKIKPGLTFIAKKTGAQILPVGCYCRHAYHVPRWDRYTLPLPFSKIHIHVGSLITVPGDVKDLEETNRNLEGIFNRLTFQATANYYEL